MSNASITNRTVFDNLDDALAAFGFSWWVSSKNLFGILVPSLLGFASEFICFLVFVRIPSTSNHLFIYLRAYALNGMFVCFNNICLFFYRLYSIGNNLPLASYMVYFNIPLLATNYLCASLIDVITLLDRISIFDRTVKKLMSKASPYPTCIVIFLISFLVNLPYFFLRVPAEQDVYVTDGPMYQVWFMRLTQFGASLTGQVVMILFILISDILVMCVQVLLNIRFIIYIRRYVQKKSQIVASGSHSQQSSQVVSVDVRTNIMVVIMCFISLSEHIILALCNYSLFINNSGIDASNMAFITIVYLSARRFGDIFFFFAFNSVFKRELMQMITKVF